MIFLSLYQSHTAFSDNPILQIGHHLPFLMLHGVISHSKLCLIHFTLMGVAVLTYSPILTPYLEWIISSIYFSKFPVLPEQYGHQCLPLNKESAVDSNIGCSGLPHLKWYVSLAFVHSFSITVPPRDIQ